MKFHLIKCLIVTAVLFMVSLSFVQKTSDSNQQDERPGRYQAKYHIIVVMDGPRWSETWGDTTYKLIPNLANTLRPQGTFFSNFKNDGVTLTNSGHTAMTTGVYQRISNVGKQLPKNPNIFQYYLKQYKVDKTKTWILTSKGKLEMLANTKKKDWWNKYQPATYCGTQGLGVGFPNDRDMYPTFKKTILENKPHLAIVNFLDADAWAHQGSWEKYVNGIKEIDGFIADLWNAIQADPEMGNKTAMYITNDHGRHLEGVKKGFESHGCKCDGCRHISLLALGPDFEKGKVVSTHYGLIDIPATIAHMMEIAMPTGKGKPITELISNSK